MLRSFNVSTPPRLVMRRAWRLLSDVSAVSFRAQRRNKLHFVSVDFLAHSR